MKLSRRSPGIFKSTESCKITLIGHASANSSLSYWAQRHRIFSKYDDGVWLTDDAWFGVTPEPVAKSVCPFHVLSVSISDMLTYFTAKLQHISPRLLQMDAVSWWTALLALEATPSHSQRLANGSASMPSRRIPPFSNVPNTTPRSTEWRTRSPGSRATASRS